MKDQYVAEWSEKFKHGNISPMQQYEQHKREDEITGNDDWAFVGIADSLKEAHEILDQYWLNRLKKGVPKLEHV